MTCPSTPPAGLLTYRKRCPQCSTLKDSREFNRKRGVKGGLSYWCRSCTTRRNKKGRQVVKRQALAAYAGDPPRCQCPGCAEYREEFLTIDHLNNDGAEHRRAEGVGGSGIYWWLRRNGYPPGFRVLCWNCNCARGQFGYCPHERETTGPCAPSLSAVG
jgi:hypothetical protein